MSAGSDRRKKQPQRPPVADARPGASAISRGFAASFASRGRTERAVGLAACVALAGYLGAALVKRWGADREPQPLYTDHDSGPDRRSSSAEG
jgi:hypothetical protein